MRTENQFRSPLPHITKLLMAGLIGLATLGCIAEDPNQSHTVMILLPDGATQEITPPTVCLGITPPDTAWQNEPGPLLPPPDPEPIPIDDENAANTDGQETGNGENAERPPPEDAEEPDPCVETPSICVSALPPHDWQLENFQTLSCGYGATYGLSTLRESVTFVVLLAAW